jgi:hypothetical protein
VLLDGSRGNVRDVLSGFGILELLKPGGEVSTRVEALRQAQRLLAEAGSVPD